MTPSPSEAAGWHSARLSAREALVFEAGVKLGGIFHQYLGTPVGPRSARALERSIEAAVRLQPFVTRVRVSIDVRRGGPVGAGRFGYHYLTAPMLEAEVTLVDGPWRVVGRLAHRPKLRYPLMEVRSIGPSRTKKTPPTRARRSAGRQDRTGRRSARSGG